jgi:hypothetical protein
MLNLQWSQNGVLISGYNYQTNVWVNEQINYGILFPDMTTPAQKITLASSAAQEAGQTLTNVSLYLDGAADEIEEIQLNWPAKGGGLQVSFDGGVTYNTFSLVYGYKGDSTTWPILPAGSMSLDASDGIIRPIDTATLLIRCVVPASAELYEIFSLHIEISCDVV